MAGKKFEIICIFFLFFPLVTDAAQAPGSASNEDLSVSVLVQTKNFPGLKKAFHEAQRDKYFTFTVQPINSDRYHLTLLAYYFNPSRQLTSIEKQNIEKTLRDRLENSTREQMKKSPAIELPFEAIVSYKNHIAAIFEENDLFSNLLRAIDNEFRHDPAVQALSDKGKIALGTPFSNIEPHISVATITKNPNPKINYGFHSPDWKVPAFILRDPDVVSVYSYWKSKKWK